VLEPAIYAPSSCNRQPWEFHIVENDQSSGQIINPSNYGMLDLAPYVIYLSIDSRFHPEKFAPAIDAGIVAQNILLSLEYHGYSGCPVYQSEGINQKEMRKRLGMDNHQYVYLAIPFGIGRENVKSSARVPIEDKVTFV
jgi:nitroreductase